MWCYVNNFSNTREPLALQFEASQAEVFKQQINELIDQLLATFLPPLSTQLISKKSAIDYVFNRRYDKAIEQVEREAHKRGVAVYRDSSTISFTPMRDGKAWTKPNLRNLANKSAMRFIRILPSWNSN